MSGATPLRWASLVGSGITWFTVDWSAGPGSEVCGGAAVEVLALEEPVAGRAWVVRVEGAPDRLRYVREAAGEPPPGAAWRLGSGWAVLAGPVDVPVGVVDAAAAVGLGVVLLRVPASEVAATTAALEGAAMQPPPGAAPAVDLVAVVEPGSAAALVGWPEAAPPRWLSRFRSLDGAGARLDTEVDAGSAEAATRRTSSIAGRMAAMPPSLGAAGAPPTGDRRRRARAVGLLAASAAVVVAGVAAWRLHASGGPGTASPQASARPTAPPGATLPPAGPDVLAAYDEAHGQTVLFDGDEGRTWLLHDQTWALQASGLPRHGSAAVYDPGISALLLVGGRYATGEPADTMAWTGVAWVWFASASDLASPVETPAPAWDAAHAELVAVTAANGAPARTWAMSGISWAAVGPVSGAPTGAPSAVAWDPKTRTVLGLWPSAPANGISAVETTWSWDGSSWRRLSPAHSPAAGAAVRLALDPQSGGLLLAASSGTAAGSMLDMWRWTGSDWDAVSSAAQPGSPAAVFTNPADGLVELLAAPAASSVLRLWGWTGAAWTRLADGGDAPPLAGPLPAARDGAALAYDPVRRTLVLHGGQLVGQRGTGQPTPPFTTDTWLFDGTHWLQAAAPAGAPPPTGTMAFDPTTGLMLLVADANGPLDAGGPPLPQTWAWDGRAWTALHPATEIAPGRVVDGMSSDPATGGVVAVVTCCAAAFGTVTGAAPALETWTWDGSRWSRREMPSGLGGWNVTLAYDPASRAVIGVASSGDVGPGATWAWDGSSWRRLTTTSDAAYDPLSALAAADEAAGNVVLLDRVPGTFVTPTGTQTWNGAGWTDRQTRVTPDMQTARGNAAMYFDVTLGHVVVVGPAASGFDEEWLWTRTAWVMLDPRPPA